MRTIKELNKLLILIFCLLSASAVFAQDRSALEQQRKKLIEEIKVTERILSQTRTSVKASLEDLGALRKQISLRERLISTTVKEINLFDSQITKNQTEITRLNKELDELKKDYSETIQVAYTHQRLNNKMNFILSASNFNQAYRRMNYLRKIGEFRNKQSEKIKETQAQISKKIRDMEAQKKNKQLALVEQKTQKKQLDSEKAVIDEILAELKGQEKQLTEDIRKKQDQAKKLNAQIEDLIRKEIEAARKKEGNNTSNTEAFKNTPEYINLSKDFAANKGKLPWPVEKGYIAKKFGTYRHPDLDKVELQNNGVDIRTEKHSSVRAVFDGKVIGIINNPTYKNAVIINHGAYFSVYTKLNEVYVTRDQKVSTKDLIGKVYTDDETGTSEIHLEIWKGQLKLDPALWLFK